ncbi:MAG: amino acid adenylation domain-containing protein, partial [Cyclobacteriaceae bacterium]
MNNTLTEILQHNAGSDTHGMTFIESHADEVRMSYKALYMEACHTLAALRARGVQQGGEVVIQVEDNRMLLVTFWACILGGMVPVPLSVGGRTAHLEKFAAVWSTMSDPYWVVEKSYEDRMLRFLAEKARPLPATGRTFDPAELLQYPQVATPVSVSPDSLAYIQYSSGSTGNPKGVMLSHCNLVTNASDIVSRSAITAGDRLLSWMPLTHDMGMICFHLAGLIANVDQYLMPTGLFIRRPSLWVQKASVHQATHLYSPNFGYHYLLSNFDSRENIDLSSVKLIYNGAEPISAALCKEFIDYFRPYGLLENALYPGYGLAEASVAVTLPEPGAQLRAITLQRDKLETGDEVVLAKGDSEGITFVKVGKPVLHCEVRIAGNDDRELPAGRVGHIQIKGGNVSSGYYRNGEATKALYTADGWLRTGDLGLWHIGDLVITGRAKNLIIINGQNYYPHDLERVVMDTLDMEAGTVVAAASRPADNAGDDLLFFVLYKKQTQSFYPITKQVKQAVFDKLGLEVKEVLAVRQVPKTTSGKVQHFDLVKQYEQGEFNTQIRELATLRQQQRPSGDASVEVSLAEVWSSLFGAYPSGSTLAEAGLNSLQAGKLAAHMSEKTGIRVSLKDIFDYPDLPSLAKALQSRDRRSDTHTITKAPESDTYPVTFQQQRFWYLEQLGGGLPVATIPVVFRISGKLDKLAMSRAWDKLVERHESLRTVFVAQGKEVRQQVLPSDDVLFAMEYAKGMTAKEVSEDIQARTTEPSDLAHGPLVRSVLYEYDREQYDLFIKLHHSIADGWSVNVLLRDLSTLYHTETTGETSFLTPLALQQKDVAVYEYDREGSFETVDMAYWRKELDGFRPEDNFWQKTAYTAKPYEGDRHPSVLDAEAVTGLNRFAAGEGGTLFMALATGLASWVHRFTGSSDFVIGTDFAGRDHLTTTENQVGCYLNSVPLRITIDEQTTVKGLFRQVRDKVLQGAEHQAYPAEQLIPTGARSAPYHVLLILQNFSDLLPLQLTGLHVEVLEEPATGTTLTDLHLECIPEGDTLKLTIRYSKKAFTNSEIEQVTDELKQAWASLPVHPDGLLRSSSGKVAVKAYEDFTSVVQLFEKAAQRYPDNTALSCGKDTISYRELSEKVDKLAGYLTRSTAAETGKAIAMLLSPSIDMVTAMLAIQKAGRPFLPMDPAYPADRVAFMLNETQAGLLLTDKEVSAEWNVKAVSSREACRAGQALATPGIARPDQAAYILYTSGTTGQPKGVIISREAFSHYVQTFSDYFQINSEDRVIQQASPSFDTILEEVFPALASGAEVLIAPAGGRDVHALINLISEQKATVLSATPLVINELNKQAQKLSSLRLVISGGDALQPSHIDHLLPRAEVYNTYGPTETTVCATYHKTASPSEASVIGKALPGKEVWLLDEHLEGVDDEVPGELYIGGKGLALGYLDRPEEEARSFITNPFDPSQKVYRTGDLARRCADGSFVFIGRRDRQVKIRGHRVEPAEVENILSEKDILPGVVIQVKLNPAGERVLIAYHTRPELEERTIRQAAARLLPDYMVPGIFVGLEAFPLSPNGKVDKRALPDPFGVKPEIQPEATPEEKQILAIWQDLHGEDKLSVTQNFFAAGGNSISAVQLAARISELSGRQVGIQDVFMHPTVRELAELVADKEAVLAEGITKAFTRDFYPLSHAQKRMWLLQQMAEEQTAYNLSWAFDLRGLLDTEKLEQALQILVDRHPALRTQFINREGSVLQQVLPAADIQAGFRYIDKEQDTDRQVHDLIDKLFHTPFDLTKAPLLRTGMIRRSTSEHILYLSLHHIIADGWSMNVLAAELATVYNALISESEPDLPAQSLTPADYAMWETEQSFAGDENYWLSHLTDPVPVLDLPSDKVRPAERTSTGRTLDLTLGEAITNDLKKLCTRLQTTPFVVLMAATKALLYRYTGKTDMVLGTPVALRDEPALQRQVGNLLNTLALRTSFERPTSFAGLIRQVKQTVEEGVAHKHYPFDRLVEKLDPLTEPGRSPLFDIMVGYQEKEAACRQLESMEGLQINPVDWQQQYSQFDLSIDFFGKDNSIDVRFEYSDEVFSEAYMLRLVQHFQRLVQAAVAEPEKPVSALRLLSVEEEGRLLHQPAQPLSAAEWGKPFIERIEEQAVNGPEKVAIHYRDRSLTFKALNEQANQVAHVLREDYQVKPGEAVGLLSHASDEAVIVLLGIIKAGAVFVPVDPAYPAERVHHIITQSGLTRLIASDDSTVATPGQIQLAALLQSAALKPAEGPGVKNALDDLIYIIHTSGSTGLPKGVAITHGNVQAITASWQKTYRLESFDVRSLTMSGMAFDVFFGDLCRTLCFGGELVICPPEQKTDPAAVLRLLATHRISFMESTPGLIIPLFDYIRETGESLPDLNILVAGSDVFSAGDCARLREQLPDTTRLLNSFGTTETTIDSSCFEVKKGEVFEKDIVPVGTPLPGVTYYVLDAEKALLPAGLPGELYIGGIGVGKGYVDRPELTAERFIAHPFKENEILYR